MALRDVLFFYCILLAIIHLLDISSISATPHLAGGLDSLTDTEVQNYPGCQVAAQQLPPDTARYINA